VFKQIRCERRLEREMLEERREEWIPGSSPRMRKKKVTG
jgi:hypothetical protein